MERGEIKSKEILCILALLSVPSLPAVERSVLCHSLRVAVGSQPRAGPGPYCRAKSSAERNRLPGTPFLGPVGHQ